LSYEKPTALNPFAGTGYQLPTYPFVVPPEIATGQTLRHPVVIVGAGLAGLTAACDFAIRGIPAIVIDEDDTVGVRGASSRGICYAQKSLEIFRRLGIYDRIKAKGVQWSVGKTLAGQEVVYEFDLTQQSTHNLSLQPPFINLQQFYLEWFLVDRINEIDVASIRWQSRVKSVVQMEGYVELEIETPAGIYRCQADWLIDASGLRSPIRQACGLKVEEAVGVDRWCISDVRFTDKKPVERWTWIEAPFNDGRAVWQHLMADDVWRLDYQMEADADPEHVSSPAVVADRLKRHLGDDVEFELVWVGPYAYKSHLLESFSLGRIFFAGDCAHVMSPFGARGGNSAIQDADNLVWKLTLVIEGQADEKILSSYSRERREGAQTNIQITNRTARYLSPRSTVEKMIRNATIELAKSFAFARSLVNTGRLSTANIYTDAPLSMATQSLPIQNFSVNTFKAPAPVNTVADLIGVFDWCSYAPLLLCTSEDAVDELFFAGLSLNDLINDFALQPIFVRVFAGDSVEQPRQSAWPELSVSEGAMARLLADLTLDSNRTCALVRPDLYSGGACAPSDLVAQLNKLGFRRSKSVQSSIKQAA
jgi:3-(3-hydroxy-phenyl)propionate hydroxylase